MKKLGGIFSALLTPFDSHGKISKEGVERLVDFNIANGIDGFYVGGSTGEGFLLTYEERKQLFKYAAKAVDGRVPMIAHVGAISTDAAMDMARRAAELGYDAVSAVAPFYYSFPLEAILQYYSDIANCSPLPMIIYNFPQSSGFTLSVDIVKKLFENEKFIGIKHTTPDTFALQQFKSLDREILVFNGFDEMLLSGLIMGADGAIGSTYNFMGKKFKKVYSDFRNGDIDSARAGQNEANEIIAEILKYGVFQCEKAILGEMGVDVGECRKPFLPLDSDGLAAVKNIASRLMNE